MVAESKLQMIEVENEGKLGAAEIEANLGKKLTEPYNYSLAEESEVVVTHGCSNRKHSMGNHVECDDAVINDASVPHEVVHGGSSKHGVDVDHNTEGINNIDVGQ